MAWWNPLTWLTHSDPRRAGVDAGPSNRQRRDVRAKFDAAETTPDNRRHWANADDLAADAAASPDKRRTLRNRARYEVANNSYARGIVLTLANDLIGTGPSLHMLGESDAVNATIEREFSAWAKAVNLAAKLRTMRMAKAQDGEAFGVVFTNENLATPVKIDLKLIEADQVSTPGFTWGLPSSAAPGGAVDGIVFDAFGNPQTYHVLKFHPGSGAPAAGMEYTSVPARWIIHWFRADRPGQSRGLPDIMPALPLFAQLRRYTLAVLATAETAANMGLTVHTDAPAGGDAAEVPKLQEMEIPVNTMAFMPEGWEATQIKPEQPSTTYDMFKGELLNEIARCMNMPFNIAACNSSKYNFASGQLDHQTYYRSLRVDQEEVESVVLDRIFSAWLIAAAQVYPLGSQDFPHEWLWEGREVGNPVDLANSQETRLANHTTTLAVEYAKQGRRWEPAIRQRGKEIALLIDQKLLPSQAIPNPRAGPAPAEPAPQSPQKETTRAPA